jgi:hypothetical protein
MWVYIACISAVMPIRLIPERIIYVDCHVNNPIFAMRNPNYNSGQRVGFMGQKYGISNSLLSSSTSLVVHSTNNPYIYPFIRGCRLVEGILPRGQYPHFLFELTLDCSPPYDTESILALLASDCNVIAVYEHRVTPTFRAMELLGSCVRLKRSVLSGGSGAGAVTQSVLLLWMFSYIYDCMFCRC